MARKKKTGQGSNKATWKGFYNVYLTVKDKAAIKRLDLTKRPIDAFLQELIDHDYKVSISHHSGQHYYTATAYAHTADHVNSGYACSCRHADFAIAIAGLWFTLAEKENWGAWDVDADNDSQYDW